MQVSVETIEKLGRRLTIEVPAKLVDPLIDEKFRELARTQNLRGFRPGKVPMSFIRKRYGAAVRGEVIDKVANDHFLQAIKQEGLQPVAFPEVTLQTHKEGQALKFVADIEVFPLIELNTGKDLQVTKRIVEIEEHDLDAMVQKLRQQKGTWLDSAEGACAELGHKIHIDYIGKVDGKEFEGGTSENSAVEIGKGGLIPGFEDQLIGLKQGDEKEFKLTFPKDSDSAELSGKEAVFSIKVNKIEHMELPEVDSEFFKVFGVDSGDLADFRATVMQNMERELAEKQRRTLANQVLNTLLKHNDVEAPKKLLAMEIQRRRVETLSRVFGEQFRQKDGLNKKILEQFPDVMFEKAALRQIKLSLIVQEIVKTENMTPNATKVKSRIELLASVYEDSAAAIDWHYSSEEALNQVQSTVLEEQVVEWLLERVDVSEQAVTFEKIMSEDEKADV